MPMFSAIRRIAAVGVYVLSTALGFAPLYARLLEQRRHPIQVRIGPANKPLLLTTINGSLQVLTVPPELRGAGGLRSEVATIPTNDHVRWDVGLRALGRSNWIEPDSLGVSIDQETLLAHPEFERRLTANLTRRLLLALADPDRSLAAHVILRLANGDPNPVHVSRRGSD